MRGRTLGVGRLAVALAATAVCTVMLVPASAGAVTNVPDGVLEWNRVAQSAIAATYPSAPVQFLHLAMVHGAMYDAVNAIDGGYAPYLGAPEAAPSYSEDAAAATAAYRVLLNVVPGQTTTVEAAYQSYLALIPASADKDGGVSVGEAAAEAMLDARMNDGRFGSPGFPVGSQPGQWRPVLPSFVNDPFAWIRNVRPFLLKDAGRFLSQGPNALTSDAYTRDFKEVKKLGAIDSTTRTDDQTQASLFWGQGNPAALWNAMLRSLATTETLSTAENARLFAMTYLTTADAAIACWNDKGTYLFWRPITAIHDAEFDGNPATHDDDAWLPFIPTPPYPEHPSGLACVSNAFARSMRDFFGTNRMTFGTTNPTNGISRTFTHFSDAVDEIIDARVASGVHFRTADVQGALIGRKVARWRANHFFEPV